MKKIHVSICHILDTSDRYYAIGRMNGDSWALFSFSVTLEEPFHTYKYHHLVLPQTILYIMRAIATTSLVQFSDSVRIYIIHSIKQRHNKAYAISSAFAHHQRKCCELYDSQEEQLV